MMELNLRDPGAGGRVSGHGSLSESPGGPGECPVLGSVGTARSRVASGPSGVGLAGRTLRLASELPDL